MLGKSINEVRALPATEYRRWELFYLIEPWGWHNTEYLMGKLLSSLFFIAGKGKKDFVPKDFMRNFTEIEVEPDLSGMTEDERKAFIISSAKKDFGIT